jgi:hypothetical protein
MTLLYFLICIILFFNGPMGHSLSNWTVSKARSATCYEWALHVFAVLRAWLLYVNIGPMGHSLSNWTKSKARSATCYEWALHVFAVLRAWLLYVNIGPMGRSLSNCTESMAHLATCYELAWHVFAVLRAWPRLAVPYELELSAPRPLASDGRSCLASMR